ncbi:protein TALPID3 isoform X2 [Hoplias malabaricus]|uniref:protein TALPID3 isoform X2 n=1 Tax=Hoplias malabaricus TaxID=27720 RepID=UPI003462B8E8
MDYGASVFYNTNLDDSTSSSDAADVLIRTTQAVLGLKRGKRDSKEEVSNPLNSCNVSLHVQRLTDSSHTLDLVQTSRCGFTEPVVPVVIPENMTSALNRGFEEEHIPPDPVSRKFHAPRAGKDVGKTSTSQTRDRGQKNLLISRYSANGRKAVAAALKQRSNSAPQIREVKVQFLDADVPQSTVLQPPEVQSNRAFISEDTSSATVAAITAAAIAATAPLIKAQSDIEARVTQVASELRRLQESEGRVDRAPDSRAGTAANRVTQLEEQLTTLTQQRLQHLERIQGQQLEFQNRLLGSALDAATAQANPSLQLTQLSGSGSVGDGHTVFRDQSRETRTEREKSSLGIPAPRKIIPRPTHWKPAQNSQHSSNERKSIQKNYGNGRLLEQIPNNQKSPTRCPAQSVGARSVAIATVNDSQPEQSRENQPEAFLYSTGRGRPEEQADAVTKPPGKQDIRAGLKNVTCMTQGAPEGSSSTVQQANAMLHDLSRIKDEMRSLLRTADAFPVKSAEASRSSRSSRPAPPTLPPPPPLSPVSMPSEQGVKVTSKATPLSCPSVLQNSQPPASMFEDAGRVLRQVRHSRKVLEENLQAVLRAKDGEVLHTQLEALSKNRDASEELRIKKTVDAWINALSKEIQDELAQPGSSAECKSVEKASRAAAVNSTQRDQGSRSTAGAGNGSRKVDRKGKVAPAAVRRTQSQKESINAQAVSTQTSSQQPGSPLRNNTEPQPRASVLLKSEDDEAYLAKVYGKALYEGHRRTLKKGPYLRFSSPNPKSIGHRPKVVESVKGVKMKSSKTQTSMSRAPDVSFLLQPAVSEPQYLFSPSGPDQQQQQPGCPLQGFLIPMAIPLGKPRVDGIAPLPSRVTISDKPVTVITSLPPAQASAAASTPKVPSPVRKPNTVLLEVHSEPRRPTPQLQIQVQPSVNIESVTASSPDLSPLHFPSTSIQAAAGTQESEVADEDEDFPGTNFLAVADIQGPEDGEAPENALIELNGQPSPPAAIYHGPAFPVQPAQTVPLTEPVLRTIQHRETLENRLVDWVEQQLMARMINEMFPQRAQADPADQSEPEDSVGTDIVETAGGGGLQLFVDAGLPVDSELIRQYVNEVLADIITLMLGQREGPREPAAAPASTQDTHNQQKTPIPTPLPTPEPSLKDSPLFLREAHSPVSTPELSEHVSLVQSPRDSKPVLPQPALTAVKSPVGTPASTPLPSPGRVATPSPPPELADPHKPWGDAELPLEEEEPHNEEEEQQPPPLDVLSVAHEEEVFPSSPVLPKPQSDLFPTAEEPASAPPESPSVEESSSQLSPSLTETETETAARHISEGELLFSCGQMAAVRALQEEGFPLPNLMTSFNSSLHGVQDMDYDPPSEGQVIRRPLVPVHHDPILSLLARMEQGPASQPQQPERSYDENSSGEVSEGQRPVLSAAQEKVVTGHSLIQPLSTQSTAEQSPHATLTSPGQVLVQHPGERDAVAEDSGLSFSFRPSEEHGETPRVLPSLAASSLTQPLHSTHQQVPESVETPQMVHRPAPILVKQYQHKEGPELLSQRRSSDDTDAFFEDMVKGAEDSPHTGGGVGLMSVLKDDHSPGISTVEGDSDSANEVF